MTRLINEIMEVWNGVTMWITMQSDTIFGSHAPKIWGFLEAILYMLAGVVFYGALLMTMPLIEVILIKQARKLKRLLGLD